LTVSWQSLRGAATPQALATAGGGPRGAPALTQQLNQLAVEAAAGAATAGCGCGHADAGHSHSHDHGGQNGAAANGNGSSSSSAGQHDAANGGHHHDQHRHTHDSKHTATAAVSNTFHLQTPAELAAVAAGCSPTAAVAPALLPAAPGSYGEDGLAAPLVSEVAAATADAARGLDDVIGVINDALEEVREAIEELRGEA
jgi:hypothetical protein